MPERLPMAVAIASVISAAILWLGSAGWHWLVVPVTVCGVLCLLDALDWWAGATEPFDPVGLVGVVGIYFFQVAPLLTVASGHALRFIDQQPSDYRPWIGGMAMLHVVSLGVYRMVRQWTLARPARPAAARWYLESARARWVLPVLLVVTALTQVWVFARFGGVRGYVEAFERNTLLYDAFKGTGWILMISESFPILLMFGIGLAASRWAWTRRLAVVGVLLTAMIPVFVLFGGLRGSRATIIWGLFWAAGIAHTTIRPFTKRLLLAGIPLVLILAFVWGWYKDAGLRTTRLIAGETTAAIGVQRDWSVLLLSDLSRSDVQALALWRVMDERRHWTPAWGQTYLGSLALLVPARIWPSRPPGKIRWTTDLEDHVGAFARGRRTSRVYGLSGEAILNFGPLFVPVMYGAFGILVGTVRRCQLRWTETGDARRLLVPHLVTICLLALPLDSDNLVFLFVKAGAVPWLAVTLISTRLQPARAGTGA